MVNLKNKAVNRIVWWGDTLETQHLLNRYFVHGVYDCYGLLRDFYKHHNIILPNFIRENIWWDNNIDMFGENFENAGFYNIYIDNIMPGDVILMKIRGSKTNNFANHCAVYIGDGLILHHLYNRASRIEPLSGWKKMITHCLRCNEFNTPINKDLFNE
jgi:cell wall-associated NlpC family hydrolase